MSKFKRGAIPSPRHKLASAMPFKPSLPSTEYPPSWIIVAPQYSMWLNDEIGDCVSAEECANVANFTYNKTKNELIIPDNVLNAWVRKYHYANGADLQDVMNTMAQDGIVDNTTKCTDGPFTAIDWTNDTHLCAAIYESQSNVKIAIASSQLDDTNAGNANGWMLLDAKQDTKYDHCVGLCGYGTLAELCKVLNVAVPSGQSTTQLCYLMYTWSTVGIVNRTSLVNITGEAYLRNPSSVETTVQPPPPPTPTRRVAALLHRASELYLAEPDKVLAVLNYAETILK
jgi:hypothetical protein